VLLNTIPKNVLIKIHQLPTANDIWVRLADEYGVLSDLVSAGDGIFGLLPSGYKQTLSTFSAKGQENEEKNTRNVRIRFKVHYGRLYKAGGVRSCCV
jgi:hypothetical protein